MTSRDAIVDVGLSQHVGFDRARAFRELLLVPPPSGRLERFSFLQPKNQSPTPILQLFPHFIRPLRSEMHSNCD